jgi:hypothetical protein
VNLSIHTAHITVELQKTTPVPKSVSHGLKTKKHTDAGLNSISFNLRRILNIIGLARLSGAFAHIFAAIWHVFTYICTIKSNCPSLRTNSFFSISQKMFSQKLTFNHNLLEKPRF